MSDEEDVIQPAIAAFTGTIPLSAKYPHFSFYFFGTFLAATGTLGDYPNALEAARAVNAALFCGNLVLFFVFLRRRFPVSWAVLGATLFSALPWTIVSGMLVKTEGLLIAELLVTLIALDHIADEPARLRWHALAAFGAGTAAATKLFALPFLIYCAHALYHWKRGASGVSLLRRFGFFFAMVGGIVWVNLPPVGSWAESLRYFTQDFYFLAGAGPLKAVTEWNAFPYGTFSSFLTLTLPSLMGFFTVFAFAGVAAGVSRAWDMRAYALGTLVSLAIALLGTRVRFPHVFTPYAVFGAILVVTFFHRIDERFGGGVRTKILAAVLLVSCVGQAAYTLSLVGPFAENLRRVEAMSQARGYDKMIFFIPESSDPGPSLTVPARVTQQHPGSLLVFSPYFLNMCKYKHDETYRDNCAYFHRLLDGKTDYKLSAAVPLDLGKLTAIDPEIREMAVYVFDRR